MESLEQISGKYLNVFGSTLNNMNLYKDFFVIYQKIFDKVLSYRGYKDIVKIQDGEYFNINRAPLVILNREDSPQPPNVALLNEKTELIDGVEYIVTTHLLKLNMSVMSYGNTFAESEKIGSIVLEAIMATSIAKLKELSNGNFIGQSLYSWSGTHLVNQKDKLFKNMIAMGIDFQAKFYVPKDNS